MKYIDRWGLMRSTVKENIAEHSLEVAWVAHALAVIENKFFGGDYDPCAVGMAGAYHETGEVITGDLPTPIKYFSPEIATAYKKVERSAEDRILSTLPAELLGELQSLVHPDEKTKRLVKCADKITAYIKCTEEIAAGNGEFARARASIYEEIKGYEPKSVAYFVDTFLPAFSLTLDELSE